MSKKHQSWAQNKNLGHLIALAFYLAVGYFFYLAAANMNYVWKWNSIPKYFVYEQSVNIEAPIDGKLVLKDENYFIEGTETVQLENLDSSFLLEYKIGEYVYQFDIVASKSETKITAIPKIIVQKAVTIKSQMKYNYLISFIPKNSAADSEKIMLPLLV